jgi:transmembrane sensor
MILFNNTNWNLLAKELAGEANKTEKIAISKWLSKSQRNQILYKQIKEDWIKMDELNNNFNVDNAWNKLHDRINAGGQPLSMQKDPIVPAESNRFVKTSLRIAASVVLLTALALSAIFIANSSQKVSFTASVQERGKNVVLPDGSKVYLNSNTSISYNKRFNDKVREIKLNGEAFFEVAPNKQKPFIIYANKAAVRVVGTSFNVNAGKNNNDVEVYVSEGIVELYDTKNKTDRLRILPGNIGLISHHELKGFEAMNENDIAWKTGSISFNNLKLSEAIILLNEIYNVEIVCNDEVANSSKFEKGERFQNESLNDILSVICKLNNLKVETSDEIIYLSKR